jgi:hypothetical protein
LVVSNLPTEIDPASETSRMKKKVNNEELYISGSHSGIAEDSCLLECEVLKMGDYFNYLLTYSMEQSPS